MTDKVDKQNYNYQTVCIIRKSEIQRETKVKKS